MAWVVLSSNLDCFDLDARIVAYRSEDRDAKHQLNLIGYYNDHSKAVSTGITFSSRVRDLTDRNLWHALDRGRRSKRAMRRAPKSLPICSTWSVQRRKIKWLQVSRLWCRQPTLSPRSSRGLCAVAFPLSRANRLATRRQAASCNHFPRFHRSTGVKHNPRWSRS